MAILIRASAKSLAQLAVNNDELNEAFKTATDELKGLGTPLVFLQHAALGKTNLKYGKNSPVAKQIYKSPEFISTIKSFTAPQCIKALIQFNKSKHLHAAFLDATLFGEVVCKNGSFVYKGYLYDEYDFKKSSNAKVKSAFGKMLRKLGNKASELQKAGILRPYKIRVDLDFSWK